MVGASGADLAFGGVAVGEAGPVDSRVRGHRGSVASGDMSCAHVEVLAPMVRNREPEYARNEQVLVDTAATMKADDFAELARTGAASPTINCRPSTRARSTNAATSTCTRRCTGWGCSTVISTPRAPRPCSKHSIWRARRTRPAVPCRRVRWRSGARMRWSTSPRVPRRPRPGRADAGRAQRDHGLRHPHRSAGGSASGAL